MSENAAKLAQLENDHLEAEAALARLKAQWREEDRAISAARQRIWARHEQGARDRDAMRVALGGESLLDAEAKAAEDAAAKRLAAADTAEVREPRA